MTNTRKAETVAPYVLLGLTAVTGILDAVSFFALGRVFTANERGLVLRATSLATNCGLFEGV